MKKNYIKELNKLSERLITDIRSDFNKDSEIK